MLEIHSVMPQTKHSESTLMMTCLRPGPAVKDASTGSGPMAAGAVNGDDQDVVVVFVAPWLFCWKQHE